MRKVMFVLVVLVVVDLVIAGIDYSRGETLRPAMSVTLALMAAMLFYCLLLARRRNS